MIVSESSSVSSSNGVEQNVEENRDDTVEKTANTAEPTANHNENDTLAMEMSKENHSEANTDTKGDELGDETVDNLFNLPLLEVSTLMTEADGTNEDDDTNEDSLSNQNHHIEDTDISFEASDASILTGSGHDISEQLRQQLALLKQPKREVSLFASKETRSHANIRSTPSVYRRTNSSLIDESKKASSSSNAKSSTKSSNESKNDANKSIDNSNTVQRECSDQVQKSKSNGGIIDSLFNKFGSINKVVPVRVKSKSASSECATVVAPKKSLPGPKRFKRDEANDCVVSTSFDCNLDDSNHSTNSVAVEFLGFDLANKNMDVSALLPTPKAATSNEQAAFVSEYLDTFMKENSLEKVNTELKFITPKRYNADEALMTTDAQPPNLSVPARSMHRPRTLAEKRMFFQQQNDINLLIIENESTVYHELKKREKLATAYDNTLIRSIQDGNIPFTRDGWLAACWISTSNNRFLYRTISFDDMEIKLVGSRGNNVQKVAFEINTDDKKACLSKILKRTLNDCPKRCPPIDGVRINNIDAILDDKKIKTENDSQSTQKCGIFKKSRLCMFLREYLTPGPKCKKVHFKSNRKSSFDLEYGPLELVHLPTVQLDIWPQIGIQLPDHIKPILKTIPTNTNVITPEWAKFAVSVVRENPKQVKHRRKYKKPEIEKPQAITFTIPYENHEKKILIRRRRRSVIVFNENDTKSEQIESFYRNDDDGSNQLTFAQHIDPSDTVSMECASILTSMIDSVAIAVNDTNFIKHDPDIDYVGKIVPIGSGAKDSAKNTNKVEKDKQCAKNEKPAKSKLMKELKRLNVTVIDTANELVKNKKPDEICQKPFCKLGCVCECIDNAKYIQTHCQRYECMFSCTCTNTPFSEANPFYLNSSIDVLQARANARLAKEEKEFKSTIIVSENDMFVLPSTSTATKRSSKKPKRFTNDESCVDDTETETIFKSKRRRQQPDKINVVNDCRLVELQQRSNLLKSLQHVRVELKPLPDLGVEPWCMIHCLYKCHCKGRALKGRTFNFANKKHDMAGQGGWDLISPRKRQYTFERDNNLMADEPTPKVRKAHIMPDDQDESCEPWMTSARTSLYTWQRRPRRSAHELKVFRNECMFNETQRRDLLDKRIIKCRHHNQAMNTLGKSIANGQLHSIAKTTPNEMTLNASMKSANKPRNIALDYLNHILTTTMQRFTAMQERNRLTLNPTPNKLSIIPWDRMTRAFKMSEVFVWDIVLKDNRRALALTTNFTDKPKCEQYLKVTNISHADINTLPMIGKLLRDEYKTEKTKYLAMVFLRLTRFWRICGVIHSEIKYMDDEHRAKPTPDKNPVLSRKINMLYQLLMKQSSLKFNQQRLPETSAMTPRDIENNAIISNAQTESQSTAISTSSSSTSSSSLVISSEISNTNKSAHGDDQTVNDPQNGNGKNIGSSDADDAHENNDTDAGDTNENQDDETVPYFENNAMSLRLPIPITMKQRLLMLNVGDDFTHIWIPSWHKFLSKKRIHNSFKLSKEVGIALEMSQKNHNPKVFVSHEHQNCIFIGPYGNNDPQNIFLFVKHNESMVLSTTYYKKSNTTFAKKTKASWVYPTRPKNKQTVTLKIDQVYSKHTLPSDLTDTNNMAIERKDPPTDEDNAAPANGHFAAISIANGIKVAAHAKESAAIPKNVCENTSSRSASPVSATSKSYVPKKAVEIHPNKSTVWGENQVMQNSYSNTNRMPFKISSVASGVEFEKVALLTNGLPIRANEDEDEINEIITGDAGNLQPKICAVKSLAVAQSLNNDVPKFDEANDNACDDPMTCSPNKYGDILISTKTEPIDISDDENEQMDFPNESGADVLMMETHTESNECQISGYIYCTTNVQLGKVNVECLSATTIKLHLKEPVDIVYEGSQSQKRQPNLANVTKYMQTHIREKFYGIYPAHFKFDWIFISSEQFDQDAITLCDFNTLDPFSIVFKDKVIPLNSDYRDDVKLHKRDIFVVDIYRLASQLFPIETVKTMKIGDIIAKSKEIDAELIQRQNKLKEAIVKCQRAIKRVRMSNQVQNENS